MAKDAIVGGNASGPNCRLLTGLLINVPVQTLTEGEPHPQLVFELVHLSVKMVKLDN